MKGDDTRGVHLADANARTEQEAGADYPLPGDQGFAELPDPDEQYAQPPIPVFVIDPLPRDESLIPWGGTTVTLSTSRNQVLGDDRRRVRAILSNTDDTDNIVLVPDAFALTTGGYTLSPGERLEMKHNSEVYAFAPTGSPVLSVMWERVVED